MCFYVETMSFYAECLVCQEQVVRIVYISSVLRLCTSSSRSTLLPMVPDNPEQLKLPPPSTRGPVTARTTKSISEDNESL